MATPDYLIDGSNVCRYRNGTPELGILLTLLIELRKKSATFICLFDASMAPLLRGADPKAHATYKQLTSDYPEYFTEITGGVQADDFILTYAEQSGSRIISNDRYRDKSRLYPWVETEPGRWLIKFAIVGHNLSIPNPELNINAPINVDISASLPILMGMLSKKVLPPPPPPPSKYPEITSWIAQPSEVLAGNETVLTWRTQNTDKVYIKGIEPQPVRAVASGSCRVRIYQTTTFEMVVSNQIGESTRSLTVIAQIVPERWPPTPPVTQPPIPQRRSKFALFLVCSIIALILGAVAGILSLPASPEITLWTAQPTEVVAGKYTILTWKTQNADKVFIKGIGPQSVSVEASGSRQIKLDKTRTFEIVVSNKDGEKNGSITVVVKEDRVIRVPEINARIWADPRDIEINGYTTLHWQCDNAESISINGEAPAQSTGSREIKLTETTTFELVASKGASTKRDTITVNVHKRRLIFQPLRQLSSHLEQVIRPEVENFFRSKDYEIIEPRTSTSTIPTTLVADYIVSCEVTVSGWKSQRVGTPWARVTRYTLDAAVTISLIRMKDRSQLAIALGKGSASTTDIQTPYGQFSTSAEAKSKEIEAVKKGTKEALTRLTL